MAGRAPSAQGLFARLRLAFPSWRVAIAGAAAWAAVMAASAAGNLLLDGWETTEKILDVVFVYALGAAVAFPFAYALTRLLAGHSGWEGRFAAALLSFTIMTIGVTSTIYAFDYRQYYAHWHAETFSMTWMIQLAFTVAGALVQFAVTGVRLYFPVGFIALIAASLLFAGRVR